MSNHRNRHYKKRRRSGSLSFAYKLLCFIVICAAIAVAMALFFKADNIRIEGNDVYSEQEILDASGIATGDNLYLLNKYDAVDNIIRTLPYVEQVQIRRQLPNTLVITVSECSAPGAIAQDGKLWLISANGKVVGSVGLEQADCYTLISGITISEPQVGYPMTASEDSADTGSSLLQLLSLLQQRDMLKDLQTINLESHDAIRLGYLNRFEVLLPWDADWEYKLDYLLAVVERLEANETGTIDMLQDGTASFIPETKTAVKSTASDVASPTDATPTAPQA